MAFTHFLLLLSIIPSIKCDSEDSSYEDKYYDSYEASNPYNKDNAVDSTPLTSTGTTRTAHTTTKNTIGVSKDGGSYLGVSYRKLNENELN